MFKVIFYSFFLFFVAINANAATRIKDIAAIEGMRENLLVGHGLIVGLSGTGDNLKNSFFTQKGLTDFLEHLGVNIQGNLIVNVGQLDYDKVNPMLNEKRQNLINKFVDEKRGRSLHTLQNTATLSDLVAGLNKLGVWPRDIINILHNMKSVGALDAVIEVK